MSFSTAEKMFAQVLKQWLKSIIRKPLVAFTAIDDRVMLLFILVYIERSCGISMKGIEYIIQTTNYIYRRIKYITFI